jgi:acyl-CoA reductase-like NAD-dependent aldehyde dehydrogenase
VRAVAAAHAAFDSEVCPDLDAVSRLRSLVRLARPAREHRDDEFAHLDAAEVGKPIRVAREPPTTTATSTPN